MSEKNKSTSVDGGGGQRNCFSKEFKDGWDNIYSKKQCVYCGDDAFRDGNKYVCLNCNTVEFVNKK
jgi:hypothetical protein